MQKLENQVVQNDKKQLDAKNKQESFGVGLTYIRSRKKSMQPVPSASMAKGALSTTQNISDN